MAEQKHHHNGHRERMRARFDASPPATLADHELLEMLLYYTNPRRDTNEIAHALIEAFGSIEGVLDADRARLEAVLGIGEASARHLALLSELAKRYTTQKLSDGNTRTTPLDTPERIAAFLAPRFLGAANEIVYALLLDNSMRPLDCFPAGNGTVSGVLVSIRTIAERAYTKHAAAVVLAHNHPHGLAVPSSEDVSVTHQLKEALELLEIPLIEHFVFSKNAYAPILQGFQSPTADSVAASPLFDRIKKNF